MMFPVQQFKKGGLGENVGQVWLWPNYFHLLGIVIYALRQPYQAGNDLMYESNN